MTTKGGSVFCSPFEPAKISADSVLKHLVPFSQFIKAVKSCLNPEGTRLEEGKLVQLIQLTKHKHRKADSSVEVELRIHLKEETSNGLSLGTLDGGDP